MAEQDGYVQVAADGSGKKIDNTELDRRPPDPARSSTAGDTVFRQRVVVASDESPEVQVEVAGEAGEGALRVHSHELERIEGLLTEIRDMLQMFLRS